MGNKGSKRRPAVDEQYLRPQGLYPHRDVDHRKLRRFIMDAKLAPCHPGSEEQRADLEECPICFLNYPCLNRSKCCKKGMCTECFLQMKSPHASQTMPCPFCKAPTYTVEFRGAKSSKEIELELEEEQRVIEAKIRMQKEEFLADQERLRERAARTPAVASPLAKSPQPLSPLSGSTFEGLRSAADSSNPFSQYNESPYTEPARPPPSPPSVLPFHDVTWQSTSGPSNETDVAWFNARRRNATGVQPNQLLASSPGSFLSGTTVQNEVVEYPTFLSHSIASSSDEDGGMALIPVPSWATSLASAARDFGQEETRTANAATETDVAMPVLPRPPRSDEEGEQEDELDMDNLMLMEAIWRSLQDEEARQMLTAVSSTASDPFGPESVQEGTLSPSAVRQSALLCNSGSPSRTQNFPLPEGVQSTENGSAQVFGQPENFLPKTDQMERIHSDRGAGSWNKSSDYPVGQAGSTSTSLEPGLSSFGQQRLGQHEIVLSSPMRPQVLCPLPEGGVGASSSANRNGNLVTESVNWRHASWQAADECTSGQGTSCQSRENGLAQMFDQEESFLLWTDQMERTFGGGGETGSSIKSSELPICQPGSASTSPVPSSSRFGQESFGQHRNILGSPSRSQDFCSLPEGGSRGGASSSSELEDDQELLERVYRENERVNRKNFLEELTNLPGTFEEQLALSIAASLRS